jgi:hypothetical protein
MIIISIGMYFGMNVEKAEETRKKFKKFAFNYGHCYDYNGFSFNFIKFLIII